MRFVCLFLAILTAGACYADPYVRPKPLVADWWSTLLFFGLGPIQEPPVPELPVACSVSPLPSVDDPQALSFEENVGSSSVVNLDGLTRATARALVRFTHFVTASGGSITVTSAFRPAAYQDHLQHVWDKWMTELRDNVQPACQDLRSQVQSEFTRHHLLETQRPITASDHTRGIAFDAAILLPKLRRKRLTEDALAQRAGLRRPDMWHDPVHFRFMM